MGGYSKEFLISELKRFYFIYNVVPTCAMLEKKGGFPSVKVFQNKFDNWNNALTEAGLKVNMVKKHNKEDIKKKAIEFFEKYGRSPFHYELPFSTTIIRNYWNKWNDLLVECGIPLNIKYHNLKTKEDGIQLLISLYHQLGKIPTGDEIQRYTNVNRQWFQRMFGSIENALLESNLISEDDLVSKVQWIQNSIKGLQHLYISLGKCPTAIEYDNYAKEQGLLNRKALENNLKMKYGDICLKHLEVANQKRKTKDELYNELLGLKNKLGRTPMANELKEYGLSSKQQYQRTFNRAFNDMVLDFGWELSSPYLHYKEDEELLDDYYNLFIKISRLPLREDINKQPEMANYATYIKKFDNLANVWQALEIDYEAYIQDVRIGDGIICLDKNKNICLSYREMIISNILIDNLLVFKKEKAYKELLKGDNTRRRFDWFLKEHEICIEYFGWFKLESLLSTEKTRLSTYTKNALKKIEDCNGKIKLIALFPEDLDNSFEGLIKKFKKFDIHLKIDKSYL